MIELSSSFVFLDLNSSHYLVNSPLNAVTALSLWTGLSHGCTSGYCNCTPLLFAKLLKLCQVAQGQAWTVLFKSNSKFSIGLSSGLRFNHSKTLTLLTLNYFRLAHAWMLRVLGLRIRLEFSWRLNPMVFQDLSIIAVFILCFARDGVFAKIYRMCVATLTKCLVWWLKKLILVSSD